MASTLALDQLEKHADNLYEAIVIIAKRARQINEEQRVARMDENDTDMDVEDYELDEIEKDGILQKYTKLPKPTTIAINEMLDGKLKYEYEK
ncbi:DNA-directed RNA polymerase subunit omega [candidate division KSB1 bacterium]|nr:DNA-directed RNA polymerase subunit omega [candidate division KSB1 bacterium]